MRVITRNKKKLYKYEKIPFTYNIKMAILFFAIAIFVYLIGILIAVLCKGEAPMIVGGIGISSIIIDLLSMGYIIYDIYEYKNFQPSIRNMLLLQILFLVYWVVVM